MHNALPQEVRSAIANLTSNVSHSTEWGEFTQLSFPGECRWKIIGGHDWPPEVKVRITSSSHDRMVVEGYEILCETLLCLTQEEEETPYNPDLANQVFALEEVKSIIEAALAYNVEAERIDKLRFQDLEMEVEC